MPAIIFHSFWALSLSLSFSSFNQNYECLFFDKIFFYLDFQIVFQLDFLKNELIHLFHSSFVFMLIWIWEKTHFLIVQIQKLVGIDLGVELKDVSQVVKKS